MIRNSFWVSDQSLYPQTEPLLQLNLEKVGRQTKNIKLYCYESGHILIQKSNLKKTQKCLLLTFDYKYEVYRFWKNFSQELCSKGDIKTIKIILDESTEYLQLTGDHYSLLKLCQFLAKYINKIGFHQYFKVEKRIGKGNFASVFQVQRLEDGQHMAVKAFHKKTLYQEQFGKEGLINEINIMRKLDHPNLMKLYEVYETENSIYMCVELLKGGQLYDHYKFNQDFDQKTIFQIMEGLVSGIRYLHKNGIMHRDLKLENILFREKDNYNSVVIADFGLSTEVDSKPYLYSKCGTPGFIAPEIINLTHNSSAYEYQCDMYSLGIIFYLLITGQPAFKGRNYQELVKNNQLADIDFSLKKLKQIPQTQYTLLKKLLHSNPNRRITSLQAMNHAYFNLEFDEIFAQMSIDDDCHLDEMISKISTDYVKQNIFITNDSKEKDDFCEMLQTDELIVEQNEMCNSMLKIFMRSPVITGSTRTITYTPSKKRHHLPDELNIQLIQ